MRSIVAKHSLTLYVIIKHSLTFYIIITSFPLMKVTCLLNDKFLKHGRILFRNFNSSSVNKKILPIS